MVVAEVKPSNKYHYQKGLTRDFFKENYYFNKDRTLNEFAKSSGGFLLMFVLFLFRVVCTSFNYLMLTPPVALLYSGWRYSKVSPLAGYTVRKMPYEIK